MADKEILSRLRVALVHAEIDTYEDKQGYEVVKVVFPKNGESYQEKFRSALQDVIDGGESGGTNSHERV